MKDQARHPNEIVLRFVAQCFDRANGPALILDIGSGSGANAKALRERGWTVHTIDNDPTTEADFIMDIRHFKQPDGFYDLILDCNTLCHVEDAPYQKIFEMLDDHGAFFSIHPQPETVSIIAAGRWTREASEWDLRESLKMFSTVQIGSSEYPDPRRHAQIKSWIITAKK